MRTLVPGKVSALITTYNHRAFIEEAVNSVLAQTYPNIEIVITDDCSTDGAQDIIRRLAREHPRIIPVLSDRNTGIAANVNRGLARCDGEFLTYLGGDDLMYPAKIEKQVAYMRAHPDAVVCYHDVEVFDSDTGLTLYRHGDIHEMKDGGVELELFTNWSFGRLPKTIPSSHMVRASALPPHGFDERIHLWNDWLHGIEVLQHGWRGHIPEVLGRYRKHAGQITQAPGRHLLESFEEEMMALGLLAARYPKMARYVRRRRTWILAQSILYELDEPSLRSWRERQLRLEAGVWPWLYVMVGRFLLRHRRFLRLTGPVRDIARRLLGVQKRIPTPEA